MNDGITRAEEYHAWACIEAELQGVIDSGIQEELGLCRKKGGQVVEFKGRSAFMDGARGSGELIRVGMVVRLLRGNRV
jgi:hypothetical protein